MKFVTAYLHQIELRATRVTASKASPKNMNGSHLKANSHFRAASFPEAISKYGRDDRRRELETIMTSVQALQGLTTRIFYFSMTAAVFVFIAILLTGIHP
jgi:hypothetical protein